MRPFLITNALALLAFLVLKAVLLVTAGFQFSVRLLTITDAPFLILAALLLGDPIDAPGPARNQWLGPILAWSIQAVVVVMVVSIVYGAARALRRRSLRLDSTKGESV